MIGHEREGIALMVHEKKRTPGSVERHAANRAENETANRANVIELEGRGLGGARGERPSRVLRRLERAQRFADRIEGPEDAA